MEGCKRLRDDAEVIGEELGTEVEPEGEVGFVVGVELEAGVGRDEDIAEQVLEVELQSEVVLQDAAETVPEVEPVLEVEPEPEVEPGVGFASVDVAAFVVVAASVVDFGK